MNLMVFDQSGMNYFDHGYYVVCENCGSLMKTSLHKCRQSVYQKKMKKRFFRQNDFRARRRFSVKS